MKTIRIGRSERAKERNVDAVRTGAGSIRFDSEVALNDDDLDKIDFDKLERDGYEVSVTEAEAPEPNPEGTVTSRSR